MIQIWVKPKNKNRATINRYILLDRDGTLIVHVHYLTDPLQVTLLPNVIEGLKLFQNLGFRFGIVTNQSIIGQGLANWNQVDSVNHEVIRLLSQHGISIDFVYVCPHTKDDGCDCRKPKALLGHRAIKNFDIGPKVSFMIGDQASDVMFGHAISCGSIQIKSEAAPNLVADFVAADLLEAAIWVKEELDKS